MSDASTGLLRSTPATFRYQKPYADGSKPPLDYGLIAEVYPDLVVRSEQVVALQKTLETLMAGQSAVEVAKDK